MKITELQYMRHTSRQAAKLAQARPTTACSKGGNHSVCATATVPPPPRCLLPCYTNIWRQQL